MFWLAPPARFRLYTRAADYVHLLLDVLTGRTAAGDDVRQLERAVAARVGAAHAMCVPQARVGIHLAVRHLIRPGQAVVMSPYTIADVVNMVICAGGVPVFADIDPSSTNIAPADVERLIDDRTGAVLVTHLHGIACEVEAIAAICRAKGVPLIEDAAQAFGARVGGRSVGTFGDAGVFSFGMYKNVTAFYGGMVVTPNESLDRAMRSELADAPLMPLGALCAKAVSALVTDLVTAPLLFRTFVYWLFRFAHLHDIRAITRFVTVELDTSRKDRLPASYRCRFRPVQARMVRRQLDRVDANAAERVSYARIYHDGLSGLAGLVTPPFRDDGSCVYNYVPIQCEDREALVRWAMRRYRDMAVQHLKNCAALPAFAPEQRECPNADRTAAGTVLLPNYPGYGEAAVRRNVAVIREYVDAGAPCHERT
ncbi:MAG: hypothetical protein FJW23_12800 [Acidimicrobiia bacterium]|nr:hypothetical protein [Acidimicrobiia bacterium]